MANEVKELMKARRKIEALEGSLKVVSDGYKQLESENKKLLFMIENGLGWEDMKGGIREDLE